MEEKRRFYRIDDSVSLSYKTISEADLEEAIGASKVDLGRRQKLLSSLAELDGRINALLLDIDDQLPEVATVLKLLNRKIHIVGQMSDSTEAGDGSQDIVPRPTHKISLSASGVSFHAPASVRVHDCLELSLTLFPEYYFVKAFGRVVSCRDALPSSAEFNKLVAVDFVYLDADDQDYIMSHVLKKQSQLLRDSRSD
ncbi:MAG: hypothetical protein KBT88_14675 [Gammaproteobacteria bacterium]|nr:hypothetical protein [Gammaproteobacteria bacterium]MBQ0841022.1 hypothetical protein [Gammaproteobacteria bacterium]